ncbi:unnamed protein product [Didymodactylos carnosus]|uniref:Egal-1 winged helix domain-containing protein n=1 Tax=Didymodactylos carnosus TaxID=1234261 RepID=A0A814B2Y4_9BILA|nr:unnamed protein product [Didymodactylos carnosus]CAF1081038.1 unnamed protein product [Didymodactylos carnosus]CAF3701999.1 unnamed protein product [Didymodactylos carnosus]CAF3844005.1 unnamed protein product [Didymodactylos carnosus]
MSAFEKTHGISIDEPPVAHQAILFILHVLIRNEKEMTLTKLYDSFSDKTFTTQMLREVGGNEQGLQQFLLQYPSIFTVTNEKVSANSDTPVRPIISSSSGTNLHIQKPSSSTTSSSQRYTSRPTLSLNKHTNDLTSPTISNSLTDANNSNQDDGPQWDAKTMKEIEQEAIIFFRKQIQKREEEWLPIVSVAGHASQASCDVRKFVGPQNEFKTFLVRYPQTFIVREDYCGLRGKCDQPGVPFPPPSPPPKRRIINGVGNMPLVINGNGSSLTRSTSFRSNGRGGLVSTPTSVTNNGLSKRLTPIEVKAVHYVMRLLYKNGRLLLQNVSGLIVRAPDYLSNVIGFTRDDLIVFFKRHNAIFQLHTDGCISVKQDAVKALILKERSYGENSQFTSSGIVLRIFPKYGILNMDNNEQVFFDIQSCQFETFNDLTCVLHPGDYIYFNAILGPKEGSTKWKSLKTWTKQPKPQQLSQSPSANNLSTSTGCTSPSYDLIDDQQDLNQYQLENGEDDLTSEQQDLINSSRYSSNQNSFPPPALLSPSTPLSATTNGNHPVSLLSSTCITQQYPPPSNIGPMPKMVSGVDPDMLTKKIKQLQTQCTIPNDISLKENFSDKFLSQGCQTITTGEILATNIHID